MNKKAFLLLAAICPLSMMAFAQTTKYIIPATEPGKDPDTVVIVSVPVNRVDTFHYQTSEISTVQLKKGKTSSTPAPTNKLQFNLTFSEPDALNARNSTPGVTSWFPNSKENPGTTGKVIPTVIADPYNSQNKVLRMGINTKNTDDGRLRNEMTAWNLTDGANQHAVYHFEVFIPNGYIFGTSSNNFIQFHDVSPFGRIPAVSFMLKKMSGISKLDLNIAWATTPNNPGHQGDIHEYFDVTSWIGKWVKIDLDINWFQNSSGYFKMYLNGSNTPFYSYTGPIAYAGDEQGPYMKWGLHDASGVLPPGSTENSELILYDNIRIATGNVTLADVR